MKKWFTKNARQGNSAKKYIVFVQVFFLYILYLFFADVILTEKTSANEYAKQFTPGTAKKKNNMKFVIFFVFFIETTNSVFVQRATVKFGAIKLVYIIYVWTNRKQTQR